MNNKKKKISTKVFNKEFFMTGTYIKTCFVIFAFTGEIKF